MNKSILVLYMSIGGLIGGYLPVWFGADAISLWSILGSGIGSLVGIYFAAQTDY